MAFAAPTTVTARAISVAPIPLRNLLPWAILVGAIAVTMLYFVGVEQGATSFFSSALVHEFVHDGRHLLGFPCH